MDNQQITKAVEALRDGGLVIFPTDTAFGIGCRIDDGLAVEKLFQIRRRPHTQATPVLFSSIAMVQQFTTNFPPLVQTSLMDRYWPGGLTIILPAKIEKVPDFVRGGTTTIGARIPGHPLTLSIIEQLGVPIVGTSANFPGEPTPYLFEELDTELTKLVDVVVEGECMLKKESTVIDCTATPWRTLREGAVQLEL